jgi:hypothetical protein
MGTKPKKYTIPSRDWGITADEAANILVSAKEVKANKALYDAAIKHLKEKKDAINEIL